MSVFSKVFIIVNLLLTLLLLAAMGRKIDYSFTGTYKVKYKETVEKLAEAKATLERYREERNAEIGYLRKDQQVHNEKLTGLKTLLDGKQRELDQTKKDISDKKSAKNTLNSQIQAKESEGQNLDREEKRLQDELKAASGSFSSTLQNMKRAVNSYFATKRLREDLEAAVEARRDEKVSN